MKVSRDHTLGTNEFDLVYSYDDLDRLDETRGATGRARAAAHSLAALGGKEAAR